MIKEHQRLKLYDKPVFEKAIIVPPLRMEAPMANEACFYYIVSGKATVITASGPVHLKEENGIVLKCGNYLNDYLCAKEIEQCEAIAVHFYPDVLQLLYEKEFPAFLQEASKIQPVRFDHVHASQLLANYIQSLQFYFENPKLVSDELLQLKLKELILLLAKTDNLQTIRNLILDLFSDHHINFKDVIESNLYTNLTIQELANLCHLSLSSFKRAFRRHYNTTPAKYIKHRRLMRASQLLRNSNNSISQVAFECGFSDLAHFSKSFHHHFGSAPSQYRLNQIDK